MLFISTELDAVNALLASVGDAPVNSLDDTQSIDVYNALRMLEEMSRQIQRRGWQFNTELNVTLKPDVKNKQIRYNPTWIQLFSTNYKVYVKRGDYLYNLTDKTLVFDKDIIVNIIEAVDFEDMPDCFKSYITAKAAIKFQSRYLGDTNVSQMLVAESNEAYADIVQYTIDTGENMLLTPIVMPVLNRECDM